MPIKKEISTIFIHIPKCAGTSVEKMLDMSIDDNLYCRSGNKLDYKKTVLNLSKDLFTPNELELFELKPPQHYSLRELSKLLPKETIDLFYKFTIVRNPYSRLVSEYYYSKIFNKNLETYPANNFNEFAVFWLNQPEKNRISTLFGHLETQTSFLINDQGNLNSINDIFKYENLTPCFDKIQQLYPGVKIVQSNSSHFNGDYRNEYSTETAQLVYNFYKDDFINFGYSENLMS
jgi:hypothetical protein